MGNDMRLHTTLFALIVLAGSALGAADLTKWVAEPAVNPRADRAERLMDDVTTMLDTGEKNKDLQDTLEDVAKYARHPHNRARALLALGDVRTLNGDYYDAFEAYRESVTLYSNLIPLEEVITKEYNLATDHLRLGKRKYTWLPFKGNDQAVEVYDHIVDAAPQHYLAPLSLFRAGVILRWEKDYQASIDRLRRLIHDYPNARSAAHAQVEIAQSMLDAASEFDGDGSLASQAKTYLERFFTLYPNYQRREQTEGDESTRQLLQEKREQAGRLLAQANEIEANRYLYMAQFYQNPEHQSNSATRRFLNRITNDYAETEAAPVARAMLAKLPPPGSDAQPEAAVADRQAPLDSPTGQRGASTGVPAATKEAVSESAAAAEPQPQPKPNEKWLLPIRDIDTDQPLEDEETAP